MKKHTEKSFVFDENKLAQEIIHDAKVIGLGPDAAKVMASAIVKKVSGRISKRSAITVEDLNRFVAEAAEKYNNDLAYFYQNRGKII